MSSSANICQTFQPRLLFKILNPTLMLYCDPNSENYSFDVVKFAYLTMPRITQSCWPYSIIYALIISPRNTFQPHSLLSSGSRHRLSVGSGSGKSLKQSISSPAISDIIKSKVGDTSHGLWYYYVNMFRALRAANLLITSDSFRRQYTLRFSHPGQRHQHPPLVTRPRPTVGR